MKATRRIVMVALGFGCSFGATRVARAAPMFAAMTKVQANDNPTMADDGFGDAVAVTDADVLIGAPGARATAGGSGAVYVFGPSGAAWVARQKLSADDAAASDEFGHAVSAAGDVALIGAPAAESNAPATGAAYVFTRTGPTWAQQQKLVAVDAMGVPNGTTGDLFGGTVSISGDVAIVGAPMANGWFGAAYVFVSSGSTWTLQQTLTSGQTVQAGEFGSGVAVSGGTVFVGAPYTDAQGGAVYAFVQSGTTWTLQQVIQPNDAMAYDGFGSTVALSGDTALVGPYVFVRSGATWTQQQKLAAGDDLTDLGGSVAVSGETALLGARWATVGANDAQGAAYLFEQSGTKWTAEPRAVASDGAARDWFGASIALWGATFAAGAPHLAAEQGSAYIGALTGVDASAPREWDAGADGADVADAVEPDAGGHGDAVAASDASVERTVAGDVPTEASAVADASGVVGIDGSAGAAGDGAVTESGDGAATSGAAKSGCDCAVTSGADRSTSAKAIATLLVAMAVLTRGRRRRSVDRARLWCVVLRRGRSDAGQKRR